jgi:outer membrane protein assembly factor BamB
VLAPDGTFRSSTPVFHDFLDMTIGLYRYFSAGAILSSPAVSGGVIFFTSTDGNLYALR